jgi:hypothetical protein
VLDIFDFYCEFLVDSPKDEPIAISNFRPRVGNLGPMMKSFTLPEFSQVEAEFLGDWLHT